MASRQNDFLFDETQYRRLQAEANSVNEMARIVWASLTFLSAVALHLVLTLNASTDENLLHNTQITLLLLGVSISVVKNYIFAPLIFLIIHGSVLFMLSVLARKVRTFEATVKKELINARASKEDTQKQQRECRNWLSALARIFPGDTSISNVSRFLTWLATSATPLTLLFVIDISFVRYQSHTITWILHVIFFLDLVFVMLFHWEVFGQREVKIPKRIGTWGKGMVAAAISLLLLFAAHPPDGTENPKSLWRYEDTMSMESSCYNLLDSGCRLWGLGCRYLDVRNIKVKENNFSLDKRNLRFARFESAEFQSIAVKNANLQKANLTGTKLKGKTIQKEDLSGAELEDAVFSKVKTDKPNLPKTWGKISAVFSFTKMEPKSRHQKRGPFVSHRVKTSIGGFPPRIRRGSRTDTWSASPSDGWKIDLKTKQFEFKLLFAGCWSRRSEASWVEETEHILRVKAYITAERSPGKTCKAETTISFEEWREQKVLREVATESKKLPAGHTVELNLPPGIYQDAQLARFEIRPPGNGETKIYGIKNLPDGLRYTRGNRSVFVTAKNLK